MRIRLFLSVIVLCLPLATLAQEPAPEAEPESERPAQPEERSAEESAEAEVPEAGPDLPVYIPPSRGAALARVGAATRGDRPDLGILLALAPDHVGLTTRAQPSVYWYLGRSSDTRVDVTFIDDTSALPLVELVLEPPVAAGLHAVDLAAHGVTLEPETVYYWYVAFVPEPERRSRDVIASGAIRRVSRAALEGSDDPVRLARAGIWYDAVMALQRRSHDRYAITSLRELAEQVGLDLSAAQ